MAFLTDRSYDLALGTEMTPIEDLRRQVSNPGEYSPATAGSPLNFGLGEGWRNMQNFARDNPAAMMSLGSGIMSGDTAGGLAQFGQYAQAARDRQLHTQRRNKTLDFLRANHPDLAGMVDAGLPVAEAWQRVLAGWRPAEQDVLPVDDRAHQMEQAGWEHGYDGLPTGGPLRPAAHGDQPPPIRQIDRELLDAEMPHQPGTEIRPAFGIGGGEKLYKPSTWESFDALPAGALYLDPADSGVYRKP